MARSAFLLSVAAGIAERLGQADEPSRAHASDPVLSRCLRPEQADFAPRHVGSPGLVEGEQVIFGAGPAGTSVGGVPDIHECSAIIGSGELPHRSGVLVQLPNMKLIFQFYQGHRRSSLTTDATEPRL
jgi:hypothetical protein